MRTALRWLARIFVGILAVLLLVFAAVTLVLRVPAVQNWLLPVINRQLSSALGAEVRVGRIELDFPDLVSLEDVHVEDNFGQPLLDAEAVKVSVIALDVWDLLDKQATERHIGARQVVLLQPRINLYVRRDSVSNLDFLLASDSVPDTTASPKLFLDFDDVEVRGLDFRYADSTLADSEFAVQRGRLNFGHLHVTGLDLDASFEMLGPGRFNAEVAHLTMRETHSGLHLEELRTDFAANLNADYLARLPRYVAGIPADSMPFVRLHDTQLRADGRTRLDFDADLRNETFEHLFRPNAGHPRFYRLEFRQSQMDLGMIEYFTPDTLPIAGTAYLQGVMTGDPERLRGDRIRLGYGQDTRLQADLRLRDYTTGNIYLRVLLYPGSVVNTAEVDQLLTGVDLPEEATRLGRTAIEGRFTGFPTDFVANVLLQSPLGTVDADMNLKIPSGGELQYSGNATTSGLNLDALLGANVSRNLNFAGRIEGRGLALATADARFNFRTVASDFAGYRIDSVQGKVRVVRGTVQGSIDVRDAQGSFNGALDINLNDSLPRYFFVGNLENGDLRHYGVTKDSLLLSTIFNINLAGDSLDNLSGVLRLFEVDLLQQRTNELLEIRDIVVNSRLNTARQKNLRIDSELFDLTATGRFSYAQLGDLAQRLVREAGIFLANDQVQIEEYYAEKVQRDENVSADLRLEVKRLNPLLAFLGTGLAVAPNTTVSAVMNFGEQEEIDLEVQAPELVFDSTTARDVDLDLTLLKPTYANNLRIRGLLTASSIRLSNGLDIENFELQPDLLNQVARLEVRATADSNTKQLRLAALARYSEGLIDGRILDNSGLIVNDSLWRFDPQNRIVYGKNRLQITNFRLYQGSQALVVESDIRPGESDRFAATVRNLDVNQLASIFLPGYPMRGVLSTTVRIRDLFGTPAVRADGSIRRFQYDDVRYGDIFVRSRLDEEDQPGFAATVSLVRQNRDTLLALAGTYDRARPSPLDFRLATHNLPVDLVEPFVRGILYDVTGLLQIEALRVTGTLAAPNVQGAGRLDNVGFGADFTKTTYRVDGNLIFSQRDIRLPNLTIRDARNNPARLDGTIYHNGFTDLRLDLRLTELRDFLFLNTQAADNNTFYGRAIVRSGSGTVRGTFDNLDIRANIRTGGGTHLYIPISSYREGDRLPYVYFRKGDDDTVSVNARMLGVQGLNLGLTVDATPDAELTLVLDEETGDYIRAAGRGNIALNINTGGEFSMNGTYEPTRGVYFLNLQGLLKREFQITSPSSITWNGSPLEAQMDIRALYSVQASLSALDPGAGGARREVDVVLNVKGSLLSPQVTFGLQLPNTSAEGSLALNSLLRSIENDPQELNKQVVSLLLQESFAPQGGFFGGGTPGGNAAANTASDLIAGQLSNALGNVFSDNVRIGVGATQFNEFNLNLQANLLNNRLTIERSGTLVGAANRNVTLGNVSVRYRLLPSDEGLREKENPGILSAEIFNRENFGYSNIQGGAVVTTSQGVGLFYRKEFESFGELFGKRAPVNTDAPVQLPEEVRRGLDTSGIRFRGSVMGTPWELRRDSIRRGLLLSRRQRDSLNRQRDSLEIDSLRRDSIRRAAQDGTARGDTTRTGSVQSSARPAQPADKRRRGPRRPPGVLWREGI